MLKVGIYGRIASGKSEVAGVFSEAGVPVISADAIGKEVVEGDRAVLDALVGEFGSAILNANGSLNRRELGRLAFVSPERTARLDSIVHPALLKELRRRIRQVEEERSQWIVVVDAALIVKWGMESEFDVLIYVTAPEEKQIERLVDSGFSRQEAIDRLNAQLPNGIQRTQAEYVIENDGSIDDLREKARVIRDTIIVNLS